MGATLEFEKIYATDFNSAQRKLEERQLSNDPYSGLFNTCDDYFNVSKSFESSEKFMDWVEEDGIKREAYFYRVDDEKWLVGGWCAC